VDAMKIFQKVKLSSLIIAFAIFLLAVISTHKLNAATTTNPAALPTNNSQENIIAQREYVTCTVVDPTGTPLNLRDFPNSEYSGINATLPNGSATNLYGLSLDNNWAFVSSRGISGWAWRAYLDCPGL
jgi:hypothetical protein